MIYSAFRSIPGAARNVLCTTVLSFGPKDSCHGNRSSDSCCDNVLDKMPNPNCGVAELSAYVQPGGDCMGGQQSAPTPPGCTHCLCHRAVCHCCVSVPYLKLCCTEHVSCFHRTFPRNLACYIPDGLQTRSCPLLQCAKGCLSLQTRNQLVVRCYAAWQTFHSLEMQCCQGDQLSQYFVPVLLRQDKVAYSSGGAALAVRVTLSGHHKKLLAVPLSC